MSDNVEVLTIGHSAHSIDAFVSLLEQHNIQVVADVRSAPYSRFAPQFNKAPLASALEAAGVGYRFLGRELGARSEDPTCYVDGRVSYGRLAQTDLFRHGVEQVLDEARVKRVALMCTEKDPLDCHRTVLIATRLHERGVSVGHVLAEGQLESHEAALERLLGNLDMQPNLLQSHEDLVHDALARQEQKIAYVDESLAAMSRAAAL